MKDKILFVDDEPAVLDSYCRLLHREFELETATSGAEAITILNERGPFAVAVSDMQMPGGRHSVIKKSARDRPRFGSIDANRTRQYRCCHRRRE